MVVHHPRQAAKVRFLFDQAADSRQNVGGEDSHLQAQAKRRTLSIKVDRLGQAEAEGGLRGSVQLRTARHHFGARPGGAAR